MLRLNGVKRGIYVPSKVESTVGENERCHGVELFLKTENHSPCLLEVRNFATNAPEMGALPPHPRDFLPCGQNGFHVWVGRSAARAVPALRAFPLSNP